MSTEKSIWTCKFCGKDTSEVEYDYLMDCCVLCGVQTPYAKSVHIDYRRGYIEGAGQLCQSCYDRGTERRQILIPAEIIYNTPNDSELGAKVRKLYWEVTN